MKKLLQINPVLRVSTSTGRIMEEIGDLAIRNGWESYIAYSKGRDGIQKSKSNIIPIGNKRSVAWQGLMTRLFDRHGLSSDKATLRFVETIKRLNPDVIHIHNIHGYFLNYNILFDYLSKSNIHAIWTIHDCWAYTGHCYHYSYAKCDKWKTICNHCPQKTKFPASYLFDRAKKNYIDKKKAFTSLDISQMTIVPVSHWMENEMRESFFNKYRFRVIHNGIDTNVFDINESDGIKEKYGINRPYIILGIAGIWSDEKGLGDFMQLADKIDDNQLIVLVGVNEKQKASLPRNILGISRTNNVQELSQLYSAADVFVNLTWQDNYPTVNLEAIACGTPVITYRTGGSVESVTEDTGLVVEQGDISGLIQAIRLIESRGKSYYKDRCRSFALKNFRKEDRYADYIAMYEDLTKQKQNPDNNENTSNREILPGTRRR
ncbi:MAG: glycosyltransferase [Candidatus Symbiothrix sp.]|jgi:glycosyltransferase involved in cell wall biosynthesis|nr:glycosyltransferase [Candidatus Symbiothrix sp.]